MIKFTKEMLIIYFVSLFVMLPFTRGALAIVPSTKQEVQKPLVKKAPNDNLDNIFGPDLNFPFRPENHRNSSSPVKRIISISDMD